MKRLRLLLLEDDTNDVIIIRRRLAAELPDAEVAHVATKAEFTAALKAGGWDLILSDYLLRSFHGLDVLALARDLSPDVPFLFLSGMVGDEVAVESLKAGATDYVLKDRPARLVPAIRRALKEAEVLARRKHDEKEMRRIQAELEESNRNLLRQNNEIQDFYHTLSHELKTPLTSAGEFISIVMDGLAGPLNKTQLEYLAIARDSCNQLRDCINDLLDATRLDTGKLTIHLEPAALDELAHRVASSLKPAFAQKKINLREEIQPNLPRVPLDEYRITQVINNLLNNAVKFTPAGGTIILKVHEAKTNSEWLEVSMSDSGCGIAKEHKEHIFDRLYQVKAGDAATGQGLGLGLYLCRELVQLHGGNIWVETEPGRGSTFTFVLPKSQQVRSTNLLLVDDDPGMIDMLRDRLNREFNVRTAGDGDEALELMRRQVPDIIVLDLALPQRDGPATLQEIRKIWGPLPVVVFTGYTDGQLLNRALAFSPFTLVAKPCSVDALVEAIRKVERSADTAMWKKNHCGPVALERN
jgi:two-component system sensor histidine kinase/response regulator